MQTSVVILASAALADGLPLGMFAARPLEATGWLVTYSALGVVTSVAFCYASQWCPAAISATVDTATRMIVGYAMQTLFFGASLEWLTVCGAMLMFVSVAAMTVTQILAEA